MADNRVRNSGQKFIARNRAPRVQIEYDVEIYGSREEDPAALRDGRHGRSRGQAGRPAAGRRRIASSSTIDIDNFDERMKAIKPRVAFPVPNTLTGDGQHDGRHHLREHGRLLARAHRPQGRRARQQLLEARTAALQPADLHGRQDRRRAADRTGAARTRRCSKSLASAPTRRRQGGGSRGRQGPGDSPDSFRNASTRARTIIMATRHPNRPPRQRRPPPTGKLELQCVLRPAAEGVQAQDRRRRDEAVENAVKTLAEQALASTVTDRPTMPTSSDRGHHRRDRPQAVRADQPHPAPRGLPEARKRLARAALPGQQHRDRRDSSRSAFM